MIARKMLDSGIMEKPPLWSKLFLWMLIKANRKDGYKGLKIGQFRTTAREMQEEMTYYVGFRKKAPTPKEIRVIYEGLSKGKAEGKAKGIEKAIHIEPMKGKRGMLITILNFEKYQNPKNYEGQSNQRPKKTHEGQSEKFTKAEVRANLISKQEIYKRNKKICKHISPDMIDFVTGFIFYVQDEKPNFTPTITESFIENSYKAILDLCRLDNFEWEYVKAVIRWAMKDDFWSDNLYSLNTLRKKSDNGLKKFQNIANKYESEKKKQKKSRTGINGSSRSEQNARACEDFITEMMQECGNE